MSARPYLDSEGGSPADGVDHPRATPHEPTAGAPSDGQASKTRARRPRPTFDDGSLTRVFKFPSKTYPRSSYYVTASEIVIRIRKARRRWKLVIPKKRIVSYRTNRWFAKPRWVEIELTYTQALRLGLTGPAAPSRASAAGPSTEAQDGAPVVGDGANDASSANSANARQDDVSGDEAVLALDADPDDQPLHAGDEARIAAGEDADRWMSATPYAAEEDLASSAAPSPPPAASSMDPGEARQTGRPQGEAIGAPPAGRSAGAGVADAAVPPVAGALFASCADTPTRFAGTHNVPGSAAVKARSRPLGAVSAGLLVGLMLVSLGATTWRIAGNSHGRALVARPPMVPLPRSAATIAAHPIETGAIARGFEAGTDDRDGERAARKEQVTTDPEVSASAVAIAPAEVPQPQPPSPAPPAQDEKGQQSVVLLQTEGPHEPSTSGGMEPVPEAVVAEEALRAAADLPGASQACRALADAARAIEIRFDYASASLDRAILPLLADIARGLPSCPSGMLIIEGHADSDGDPSRNQAVSVRRALAVRDHLVLLGASGDRLSVIGHGASRPSVPNISAENKHRNRRAVLVLELPH